jgi:Icc protein
VASAHLGVTVLNGHIYQIMQKVEGNVSFHTAMPTAFPQPTPGTAPSPGPMNVEPERLKSVLGITNVTSSRNNVALTANQIGIDNFAFTPSPLAAKAATTVTWINKDDVPHLIVNTQYKSKQSAVLDTDQRFSATLTKPGTYDYFCSLHPKMPGKIIVV